jgi:hypothetical protein
VFDFRYHALSLVAVLLALAIGLLLGVAIGDEGLVSSAERDIRGSLRKDVREARAEADRARDELEAERRFEQQAYPAMVGGRLDGLRIAFVGLGGLREDLVDDVREAIQPAGARLASVSVVREPINIGEIGSRAENTRFAELADDDLSDERRRELLERLGRRIGTQIVLGGNLVNQIRGVLFGSSSGTLDGVEGVVLSRSPPDLDEADRADVEAFENGLVEGLTRRGISVVGVEQTSASPSQIEWFQAHGLSSVDNLDQLSGKLSLVLTLSTAEGSYGVKSTADALIPKAPGAPPGG